MSKKWKTYLIFEVNSLISSFNTLFSTIRFKTMLQNALSKQLKIKFESWFKTQNYSWSFDLKQKKQMYMFAILQTTRIQLSMTIQQSLWKFEQILNFSLIIYAFENANVIRTWIQDFCLKKTKQTNWLIRKDLMYSWITTKTSLFNTRYELLIVKTS